MTSISDNGFSGIAGPKAKASHPAQIPSLDGMRAVSIAIVFAGHVGISDRIPGGFGVTIFFFLSGFLITTLFVREWDKTGTILFKAFYVRRFLRLSPPLLTCLLACYLLTWLGIADGKLDPLAIASQLLYFHNYYLVYAPDAHSVTAGLTPLWSLSVEEHFYMIFPLIFFLTGRKILTVRHYIAILIGILLWRWFRSSVMLDEEWTIYLLTDTRFDSMLFGCLLAVMQWRGCAQRIFTNDSRRTAVLLAVAFGLIIFSLLVRDAEFRSTTRYTIQGIALLIIFHYAVTRPDLLVFKPLNIGVMKWVGLYSYSIYLWHYVIIKIMEKHGILAGNFPLFVVANIVLTIGVAAFVYHVVEAPARRLRERFR